MSKDPLGDQPIEDRFLKQMNAVAVALDDIFNPERAKKGRGVGFVLLVYLYGDQEGRCNYISNGAGRDEIVKMMHEQIARFVKDGTPDPGPAAVCVSCNGPTYNPRCEGCHEKELAEVKP